ncbi:MAG TPA: glycosyltransferase [Solirubrobacterales bacterium]|nr:glycosyltransferase [Solirubrobacterales bacterium]
MSPAPEVSVYVQTYQHRDYISDALDGILAQRTPFEIEIVVADDCSTDGTRELLLAYRERHPDRIRLLLPERNLGPSEIFRRSVGELRGEFVAWLDGDDYWTDEEKLAKQVQALRAHPQWSACFHNAAIVQAGSEERPYVLELGRESVGFADLLRSNHVPSLSVMARGALVRSLPEWVWDSLWSDWGSVLAFALQGEIGYLPESMGVYRVHGEGISSGLSRPAQLEEDLRFFANLRRVAGRRHGDALDRIVRERHCQLVVERLQLPYSGAIAVLGARGEAPTELNGRPVWPLAIEPDELEAIDARDRDGSLAAQLEGFRLAAPAAEPGLAHFEDGDQVPEATEEPALRLLVVGPMIEWLDERSRIGRQLEGHCETLWQDEVCAVREVCFAADAPLPMGARAEMTEVTTPPAGGRLFGCHLDRPAPGESADAHRLEVAGWAVGDSSTAVSVEVTLDGDLLGRAPIGLPRPDLEAAFPEREGVGSAGFRAFVSLVGRNATSPIEVLAVLEDGARIPIGRFRWSLGWRSRSDPEAVPLVSVVLSGEGSESDREAAVASVRAQTHAKIELLLDPPDDVAASGGPVVFLGPGDRLPPRALEREVETQSRLAT